jgi:hypothetical protein
MRAYYDLESLAGSVFDSLKKGSVKYILLSIYFIKNQSCTSLNLAATETFRIGNNSQSTAEN